MCSLPMGSMLHAMMSCSVAACRNARHRIDGSGGRTSHDLRLRLMYEQNGRSVVDDKKEVCVAVDNTTLDVDVDGS